MYPDWLVKARQRQFLYYPVIERSPQQYALWCRAMQNMAPLPWPPKAKEVSNGR